MNETPVSQITPADEDPVVHRFLSALPAFSPAPGFEDRVMARVRRPLPMWLRRMETVRRTVFNRDTRWVWAGGLAASSAFSIAVFASIAAANWVQIETAWSVFTGRLLVEAWRAALGATAGLVANVTSWAGPMTEHGTALVLGGGASALVVTVSAWGFFRVMRQHNIERVAVHARH